MASACPLLGLGGPGTGHVVVDPRSWGTPVRTALIRPNALLRGSPRPLLLTPGAVPSVPGHTVVGGLSAASDLFLTELLGLGGLVESAVRGPAGAAAVGWGSAVLSAWGGVGALVEGLALSGA